MECDLNGSVFDFIECFTTTFLRAHSWLNWVVNGSVCIDLIRSYVLDKKYKFVQRFHHKWAKKRQGGGGGI